MINIPYWTERQQQTSNDLQHLQRADTNIEQARQRWELAKEELKQLQEQKGQLQHTWGKLKQKFSDAEKQQQQAQKAANQGVPEQARELLLQRIGETPRLEDAYLTAVEKELERLIEHTSNQNTSAKNSATYIIGQFRGKDKWSHIALQREWAVGLAALDDCVAYFHELEKEGLPALVEQFEQRLQKHTMQSLSVIQNRLEVDREEITDRIAIINQVLRRTEFKSGSYLRLGYKKEKYPHVIDFEQKLKWVVSSINSIEYEQRFKKLAELISILEKASNSVTAHTFESQRLLDPRHQMSFYAEEVDLATEEIR